MKPTKFVKRAHDISVPYRVSVGGDFRLADFDPGDTGDLESEDRPQAKKMLKGSIKAMAELQEMLYAQDKWAVLLIFQAMDAAGKDSAIKHVMSGINPQGCQVFSFKAPSKEELDHDFLWRCVKRLPERGRIGIFNRSYYEETLVVRVHPGILAGQKIPSDLVTDDVWTERFESIRDLERHLTRNGVAIRKFFLNVSKDEQRRRFIDRIDRPEKNWKFSAGDVDEREHWDEYMHAYEETIRRTATAEAPWYVVPADHKWFTRVVVAAAIVDALASLDLAFPTVDADGLTELAKLRRKLEAE
jgi:PPK2 family polyphosphate:nucleotide phosphotransferase